MSKLSARFIIVLGMIFSINSYAMAANKYGGTWIDVDAEGSLEIHTEQPISIGTTLPIVLVQGEQTLIPIGTKIKLKLRLMAPGNKIVEAQDILIYHGDTMWSQTKQKFVKVISNKPWQIKFRNPGGRDYITIKKNGKVKIGGRMGGTYWKIIK